MIDARSLHGWLGIGRFFANWFRKIVTDYEFKEGEDYLPVLASRSDGKAGRQRKDYLLTPSVAKEVAMIGNTPVGRATRRYFIQMEQAAIEMASAHAARGTHKAIPQSLAPALK